MHRSQTPAVVVIDTLNRSLNGNENDSKDMAAYIRAADAIRETFHCAVIIVHHCGIAATALGATPASRGRMMLKSLSNVMTRTGHNYGPS